MIVYDGNKTDFLIGVEQDTIAEEIERNIYQKMNRRPMNSAHGKIHWNICIRY